MIIIIIDLFRFRIDNTDHIIDVNQGTMPHEYDQINIICPHYQESVPQQVSL